MKLQAANFLENNPRTQPLSLQENVLFAESVVPRACCVQIVEMPWRLLSAIFIPQGCADCGHRFYILKWSYSDSAGAREQRWYPHNML